MNAVIKLSPIAKAVVAFVVGLAVFAGGLLTDGQWNTQDTISLIGWIAGTIAVHQVPNKPVAPPEGVELGGA